MGIDTRIYLPSDVKVNDVADVIGILVGMEKYWEKYKGSNFLGVRGVEKRDSGLPGMSEIILNGKMIDNAEYHYVNYHFEIDEEHGMYRALYPRSTPFWLAVGKRLVDFFGGKIDYDDSDDIEWNYEARKPREWNDPEDGEEWDRLQEEMANLVPISKDEIKEMEKFAAYK